MCDSTPGKVSSDVSVGSFNRGEFQVAKSTYSVDILIGTPTKVVGEVAKKPRRGQDKIDGFGK